MHRLDRERTDGPFHRFPVKQFGLLKRGTPVSITDLWIAATGQRQGSTVVTGSMWDFREIRWPRLENRS